MNIISKEMIFTKVAKKDIFCKYKLREKIAGLD